MKTHKLLRHIMPEDYYFYRDLDMIWEAMPSFNKTNTLLIDAEPELG